MEKLGLEYIDLYAIHQPYHDYYGAWKTLEKLYESGRIKAIGVDNFTQDRMKENLDIFDFVLTEDEMNYISKLDTGHSCFPARNTGAAVEDFLNQAI